MKSLYFLPAVFVIASCSGSGNQTENLADELEQSLFDYIVEPWYPRCLDTVYGGYIADFEYDWKVSESSQDKSLVNQARHLWTTAFLNEHYPEEEQFIENAAHGLKFIRQHMWDQEYGGFYQVVRQDGSVNPSTLNNKDIYGQAFAVHGLAKYYALTGEQDALDLAIKGFRWMDYHPHDRQYGGYFEILDRAGQPKGLKRMNQSPSSTGTSHFDSGNTEASDTTGTTTEKREKTSPPSPLTGLKEFNSSLHVMEAFTELYRVWPDSLLRERLEEMYLLFRDTFIHPDGYLRLFFYPDWTLVPDEEMLRIGKGEAWHSQHVTFGHDVETAFLLLEAGHALGIEDPKASKLAKQLVDHALENGWDEKNGGFYYIGYKQPDGTTNIYDDKKAFWVESEGLNALMLMHTLYPDDPHDYFSKFRQQWKYIDTWLVDKEHGGWYNYGLDNSPGSRTSQKSNNWKTTYHDVRGMVHSIEMLEKNH